jgi:hypothetical protein
MKNGKTSTRKGAEAGGSRGLQSHDSSNEIQMALAPGILSNLLAPSSTGQHHRAVVDQRGFNNRNTDVVNAQLRRGLF